MNEGTGEEGRQFNRKKEQYRLFLCDRKDCIRNEERLDAYLKTQILYQDEDICVTQEVPAFLVPGVALKSRIRIEKISQYCRVSILSPARWEQKDWFREPAKFMQIT